MTTKRKGETSYKETAFGIIPRSKLIPLEIEGVMRAWNFVLKKYAKGKVPLNTAFFINVHKVGFGWIFPEFSGKFRTIEVVVSNHKPPKAYLVSQMMLDFTNDLKVRLKYLPNIEDLEFFDKVTELLAWAHHRFLWIHPFADYNGRIGRLLINMILLNLDIPPIELKVETDSGRNRYIKALQEADKNNLAPLKKLIQSALEEAAKEFL